MTRFVYLVDDEPDARESLRALLQTRRDLHLVPFRSGDAFMAAVADHEPGCVLVDMVMPGLQGLEIVEQLSLRPEPWQTIVLTGHADVPSAVRAIKLGAIDYLEKPYRAEALFAALDIAHERLSAMEAVVATRRLAEQRIERLSAREGEVLDAILDGCSNKQVSERLGISLRTVEVHRANVMTKLEAGSIAELVRIALASERNASATLR